MNSIDHELRAALKREEPPEGFADRLLEALPPKPATVVLLPPRRHSWRPWAAAAAAAVVLTGVAWIGLRQPAHEQITAVTDAPAPKGPIFDGGRDVRPPKGTAEPGTAPGVAPGAPEAPAVRRGRRRETPATTVAMRERDAEAYLAARQLRLALTITNEKLRVAQRGVLDRSDFPTG